MHIADFRLDRPGTVEEACRLLVESPNAMILAGGTDLLVDLKQGKRRPQTIISLNRIPELRAIRVGGRTLLIGSGTTHNQVIDSPLVAEHCPALAEAASTIGTEQIRNTATVGGNLCTAASCADMAPISVALRAEVELVSSSGRRSLRLEDFFLAHRKTALRVGEILTVIRVPVAEPGTGAAFRKFGLREAANIAVASVAAAVRVARGRVAEARFVMGAVAPTPKLARRAAELVAGRTVSEIPGDERLQAELGRAVADEAQPIDDLRGSKQFRREITAVLAITAFLEALRRAGI